MFSIFKTFTGWRIFFVSFENVHGVAGFLNFKKSFDGVAVIVFNLKTFTVWRRFCYVVKSYTAIADTLAAHWSDGTSRARTARWRSPVRAA